MPFASSTTAVLMLVPPRSMPMAHDGIGCKLCVERLDELPAVVARVEEPEDLLDLCRLREVAPDGLKGIVQEQSRLEEEAVDIPDDPQLFGIESATLQSD